MGIYNKEFGRFSPYLLNKKPKPSKKFDGKYVYFYPNDKKKHGYEMIYVSKEDWEVLVEQDKIEYSNNRKHDERKTDLREYYYDDDEDFTDTGKGNKKYFSNKRLIELEKAEFSRIEDFICESLDKGKLVHGFDDTDFSIYLLTIEYKMKQNKVAELLILSESFVNRRLKVILHKLLIEKMNNGELSPSRLKAEAEYKRYIATGKTESFADVKAFLFLTMLPQNLIFRYLYCLFGTYQLFKYCFTFIFRLEAVINKPVDRFVKLMEPYSRKLYDKYTTKFGPVFKLLFIFLELKCVDNLKRVGLYKKPANEAFIKKVRKTANRCHISIEELKDKRIIPFAQKTIEKRIEQFYKQNNLPVPKKKFTFNKPQPQVRYKYRHR
ncbi:MAG: hypothetical protein IJ706_05375 [Clostridia bacterium]|nr:hypothetical protein [Clostridia bacterium]